MRLTSALFDSEVTGTTFGDRLEVNAWRGGVLLAGNLPITGWSLGWDADRQVQGQASFTVADPDGDLAPWGLADALGPGGSRLQATWVSGLTGTRVPLGWWRIRKADPHESWLLTRVPSTSTAPGPVTAINLITNPSMETAGVANSQTVRTNLCLTPRVAVGTTGWTWAAGVSEVGTTTQITGAVDGPTLPDGSVCSTYMRRSITTAKTNSSTGWQIAGASVLPTVITAGDLYTASLWVRSSVATTLSGFRLQGRNGSTSVGFADALTIPLAANVWTLLSVTTTAATLTGAGDNLLVWPYQTAAVVQPAGSTMDATALIVEEAPLARPYFDGAMTSADPDLANAWTGTAHASTSAARSTPPTIVTGSTASTPRSSQWAASGTRSVRIVASPAANTGAASTTTFAYVGGAATTGMNAGMLAGHTYTVVATCRLSGAQVGTLNALARRIVVVHNNANGSNGATTLSSDAAPNAAGITQLRFTFTLPADSVWAQVRLYNGATAGNGDVWWDNVLLVDGTYTGAYFDGSTVKPGATYAWTGTAHASTSTSAPVVTTTVQSIRRLSGGGSVEVSADEETATVEMARLDGEVPSTATCLAEVRRLLAEIANVTVLAGVTDGPLPSGWTYSDSRIDAVEDLLACINATHRMGGDGSLEVVPVEGVGPVWTLAGGDAGVLISTVRSLDDAGVYNGVTSTGETAAGQPLVERAYLTGGPLTWGGPFGKVPMFHRAIAQTQPGVYADAQTTLARRRTSGEVDLAVTCLAHPGLQVNDRVTVLAATTGADEPIEGRVVGMSLGSASSQSGTTPAKSMALKVRVSADTLDAIATRVHRG